MSTLIIHPDSKSKLRAIKAVLKALNVSFEENNPFYAPEFKKKMKLGMEDIKAGRTVKVTPEDIVR